MSLCPWNGLIGRALRVLHWRCPSVWLLAIDFLYEAESHGWMDEFSDWKRPNPIPCHFIFPGSSCLANSPLECSSCEIRSMKQDLEDLFSLWTFKEALGHTECYDLISQGVTSKLVWPLPPSCVLLGKVCISRHRCLVFFQHHDCSSHVVSKWHGCSQAIGKAGCSLRCSASNWTGAFGSNTSFPWFVTL